MCVHAEICCGVQKCRVAFDSKSQRSGNRDKSKNFRWVPYGFNSLQGAEISPLLSINLSTARARGILESIDLGADGDGMKKSAGNPERRVYYQGIWRNQQPRKSQKLVEKSVWVQVPVSPLYWDIV